MPSYLINWSIKIDADSPVEAASIARSDHFQDDSPATFFDVSEDGKTWQTVDTDDDSTAL